MAFGQQAVGQVRTKKPGGAGNKDVHRQVFILRENFNSSYFESTAMQA
jgi:hypothetical protein